MVVIESKGPGTCYVCGEPVDLNERHWQRIAADEFGETGRWWWHSRCGGPGVPANRENSEAKQ